MSLENPYVARSTPRRVWPVLVAGLALLLLPGACRRQSRDRPAERPAADRSLLADAATPPASRPDAAAPAKDAAPAAMVLPPAEPGDATGVVLVVAESLGEKSQRQRFTALRLGPTGRLTRG
jgi:hypothetical protein